MEIGAVNSSNFVQQMNILPGNQAQPKESVIKIESTQDLQTKSRNRDDDSSANSNNSVSLKETPLPGVGGEVDLLV